MNDAHPKIISRVRKLLALSENNSNPHEAASAAAMAERIMRKYQIENAEVIVASDPKVQKRSVNHGESRWNEQSRSVPGWVQNLSVSVSKYTDCQADRSGGSVHFYGVAGDAEVAAEMFRYLLKEIDRLTLKYMQSHLGLGRRASGQFRNGCSSKVSHRLDELRCEREAEFRETSAGTALIEVKQAVIEAEVGSFTYSRAFLTPDVHYQAGVEAGGNVGLHSQVHHENP